MCVCVCVCVCARMRACMCTHTSSAVINPKGCTSLLRPKSQARWKALWRSVFPLTLRWAFSRSFSGGSPSGLGCAVPRQRALRARIPVSLPQDPAVF